MPFSHSSRLANADFYLKLLTGHIQVLSHPYTTPCLHRHGCPCPRPSPPPLRPPAERPPGQSGWYCLSLQAPALMLPEWGAARHCCHIPKCPPSVLLLSVRPFRAATWSERHRGDLGQASGHRQSPGKAWTLTTTAMAKRRAEGTMGTPSHRGFPWCGWGLGRPGSPD